MIKFFKIGDTVWYVDIYTIVSGVISGVEPYDDGSFVYKIDKMSYACPIGSITITLAKPNDLFASKKEAIVRVVENYEKYRQNLIKQLLKVEKKQARYRKLLNEV